MIPEYLFFSEPPIWIHLEPPFFLNLWYLQWKATDEAHRFAGLVGVHNQVMPGQKFRHPRQIRISEFDAKSHMIFIQRHTL